MDLVEPKAYGAIVRTVLEEYARFAPSQGEVEAEVVADGASGHYELLYVGWEGWRRVHGSVVHVDVRGDHVWIQHDGTVWRPALHHGWPSWPNTEDGYTAPPPRTCFSLCTSKNRRCRSLDATPNRSTDLA